MKAFGGTKILEKMASGAFEDKESGELMAHTGDSSNMADVAKGNNHVLRAVRGLGGAAAGMRDGAYDGIKKDMDNLDREEFAGLMEMRTKDGPMHGMVPKDGWKYPFYHNKRL